LVSGLAWLSILLFGGVTVLAGQVWTSIVDDFLTRTNLRYLTRPSIATPMWAFVWIGWIALIASDALDFWERRVPGYEVTVADSYWFSYISTLTVGLGDYYLQPQGFYLGDVFHWASLFLTGFVLVSTFLGKVADLLGLLFPQKGETLAEYLARTDNWGNPIDVKHSKSLMTLEALLEQEKSVGNNIVGDDEGSGAMLANGESIHSERILHLTKKRHSLIELLADTQNDLDRCVARHAGGTSGEGCFNKDLKAGLKSCAPDLCYEEEVLELLLQRTKEARTHLESSSMESGVELSR
jgi:Ion channel